MDRLPDHLADGSASARYIGDADATEYGDELRIDRSRQALAVPERLLNLTELDVLYDSDRAAIWTFMRPTDRPSFTTSLLDDFALWQDLIKRHFGPDQLPVKYLVLGSREPGVFCFGGDLELFRRLIRAGDRNALIAYGNRCVAILHRNWLALDLPMVTVGLVQGQALGGGFEALLSFDFIIAERGSTFGLPEVTFGLFPGMGAHAFLSRKLGSALADRMILSKEIYSAEQLYEMGLVHQLAEPGEGVEAVRSFIAKSDRRHGGLVHARRAMRVASRIELRELTEIVALWADAALQLSEYDLKLMQRLASAQTKLAARAG